MGRGGWETTSSTWERKDSSKETKKATGVHPAESKDGHQEVKLGLEDPLTKERSLRGQPSGEIFLGKMERKRTGREVSPRKSREEVPLE